jgi:hypothetical protein
VDSSRLRTGEMIAAIGGLALFVFLFFDWFGAGIEGFDGGGLSGWDGLGDDVTGFVVFLAAVAGPALALLAMSGQKLNLPTPRGGGTAVLGLLSVAIIVWRIFANPGDLKVGIFLGLVAAAAIAAGALIALREDGIEALVSVPGGRTGPAAASAPPAMPAPPTAATPARKTDASGGTTTRRSSPKKSPARTSRASSRSGSKSTSSRASGARATSSRSRSGAAMGRSSSKSSGSRSSSTRTRSSSTRKRSSSTGKRSSSGGKK